MEPTKKEPSLYSLYVKQREPGFEFIETDHGFVGYRILHDECWLREFYVRPEYRGAGIEKALVDVVSEVALQRGCHHLNFSISSNAAHSHDDMLAVIAYGARLVKAEQNLIWLSKRICKWGA